MTLFSTPGNPIPAGAVSGMIKVPNSKIELRVARWDQNSPRENRGTVCVFNGRTEFIEKYFETANELRGRGFAVATMDWRGQGGSSRQLPDRHKGYVKDFSEFEADVDAFMQQFVLPNCPEPHFVLAHSMGGAAMLRVAHSGKYDFERIVLSAPMIDLAPGLKTSLARLIARAGHALGFDERYMPGSTDQPQAFEGNELTSDRVHYERNADIIKVHPSIGIGSPTVAWTNAAFDTIDAFRAQNYPARIAQPTLIFAAGDDSIVSIDAIEQFAEHLPKGSHRLIKGARHEILQEQNHLRAEFWKHFDKFIP